MLWRCLTIGPRVITERVNRLAIVAVALLILTGCGKKVPLASRPTGAGAPPSAVVPPSTAAPPSIAVAPLPVSESAGLASYYAEPYHGRRTASGEVFDTYDQLTAAHRTLPFNTVVRVTNELNGRDVEVRINDRGPFIDGRVIDLSLKAAREIDMVRAGIVPVKLTVVREGASSPRGTSRAAGPPPPPPLAVYTIQVGAFASEDAAQALRQDLETRYRDVSIQTFSTTQTFYRVRVGRLSDLDSAEELSRQLREEKLDPFVVRLN